MDQKLLKVGLVFYSEGSYWKSCNSILINLVKSYYETGYEIVELSLKKDHQEDIAEVCKQVIKGNFSYLAFIDHRLHPSVILSHLVNISRVFPPLVFHIYGDFFLNGNFWYRNNKLLKNFEIIFVCASTAQTNLLQQFFKSSTQNIVTIPFPVNEIFTFSQEKRDALRAKKSFTSSDFIFCYTGRISLQKNVLDMLASFAFIAEIIPDTKLLIAGPFDDIGIPYLSMSRLPLTMETEFYTKLKNLPLEIQNRITYMGDLCQDELHDLYLTADAYISYSVHNDEDFGMAPAEALCCGLPLFLTNWGGFMDFKTNCPEQVVLNNVMNNASMIKPVQGIKQSLLSFSCRKRLSSFSHNSSIARTVYSTLAVSKKISSMMNCLHTEKFEGFNAYFSKLSQVPDSQLVFRDKNNMFNDQYKKLYDCYLNKGIT